MIGAHCHPDLFPSEIRWPRNSFEFEVMIQSFELLDYFKGLPGGITELPADLERQARRPLMVLNQVNDPFLVRVIPYVILDTGLAFWESFGIIFIM
jgi:hypothetical protein